MSYLYNKITQLENKLLILFILPEIILDTKTTYLPIILIIQSNQNILLKI